MQTPLTPVSTSGALEGLAHLAPLMAPVLLNEAYIWYHTVNVINDPFRIDI
jgi:hypothetical protein